MIVRDITSENFSQLYKELFLLFVVLGISIFFLYFLPTPLNKYSFLFLLPAVIYSKKDYFWITYIFIVLSQPGGLFYGGEADDLLRYPLFSLVEGLSFGFEEIVLLVLLYKAISQKKDKMNVHPEFFRWFNRFLFLFLFLVILTPLLGASLESYRYIKKSFIFLSVSYTLLYNISKREMERMFALLLPFSLIALFFQVYSLTNQYQFINLFRPDIMSTQGVFNSSDMDDVQRPIEMTEILLINFVTSLYFLKQQILPFKRYFLLLINIISYIAIILAATRSWVLAFTFGYLINFFIRSGALRYSTIKSIFPSFLLLIIVIFFSPKISSQIENAFNRISTIKALTQGDITAEGTLQRYDVRAPKVIEGIKGSTIIFGAAFSNQFLKYDDSHVGYHNMFLNFGLVGFILLIVFFLDLLIRTSKLKNYVSMWGPFLVALIMLMIVNTGTQTLGFNVSLSSRYLLQFFIIVFLLKLISYSSVISITKKSC